MAERRAIVAAVPSWVVYMLLSLLLSIAAITAFNIWYSSNQSHIAYNKAVQTAQANTRQFCAVIVSLDDVYKTTPPTSALGREIANEFHALRAGLGCPTQ